MYYNYTFFFITLHIMITVIYIKLIPDHSLPPPSPLSVSLYQAGSRSACFSSRYVTMTVPWCYARALQ